MEVYVQICTCVIVQNKTGDIVFQSVFGDDHENCMSTYPEKKLHPTSTGRVLIQDLKLAKENEHKELKVDTDCLLTVEPITEKHPFRTVIDDCRFLLQANVVTIKHVWRETRQKYT